MTKTTDFTITLLLDQTPADIFNAINNVRGWWSEAIKGPTDRWNETFAYHYEDVHHCTIRVTELVPGEKISWLVLDNYFKFTKDQHEWTGNTILFELAPKGHQTQLRFTQHGLVPQYECYEICRDAWTNYVQNSLQKLITTGKGEPNGKGKPQTENEKNLSGALIESNE